MGRPVSHGSLSVQGLRLLGSAISAQPWPFAGALLGSALYAATTVGSAWVLGRATDEVLLPTLRHEHSVPGALAVACWMLLGVALARVAGYLGREYLTAVMRFRLQADLQSRLVRRYNGLPMAWHQQNQAGDLLSRVNTDVQTTWQSLNLLPGACSAVLMLVLGLAAMVVTDAVLALVGFVLFAVVLGFCTGYERYAGTLVARSQRLRGEVSSVAHESFDGALVVKALGREAAETTRFAAVVDRLRQANLVAGRVRSAFNPVMEALPNLAMLTVLLVGMARVSAGSARPGDVVQVAYLIAVLAFPVVSIGWILGEFPINAVAYQRVRRVLEAEGELRYGTALAPDGGPAELAIQSATFTHPGAAEPALRGVDLTVRAGQLVALVGPTGSGKSTLVALLARIADPDDGVVTLDGTDLRRLARREVPRRIAVVPQQTFLFRDTVRANIALDLAVDDEAIWAALRAAQAERFVQALPAGLDEPVDERGASLSGGQRQRLAIARALVRRPGLLVLDDATSAIDPQIEAALLAAVCQPATATTTLIVSHRVATIASAHEVAYLDSGRVVARGSHQVLMTDCAGYRSLITAYQRDDAEWTATVAEDLENVTEL